MSAGEWGAVIASVALVALVVGVLIALTSLSRTLRSLRVTVEDLHRETIPLLDDLHGTVKQANAELERVDSLLATAESVGHTVDSASRLAYLTFSNPAVKALALGAGLARAGRRLRRDSDSDRG